MKKLNITKPSAKPSPRGMDKPQGKPKPSGGSAVNMPSNKPSGPTKKPGGGRPTGGMKPGKRPYI